MNESATRLIVCLIIIILLACLISIIFARLSGRKITGGGPLRAINAPPNAPNIPHEKQYLLQKIKEATGYEIVIQGITNAHITSYGSLLSGYVRNAGNNATGDNPGNTKVLMLITYALLTDKYYECKYASNHVWNFYKPMPVARWQDARCPDYIIRYYTEKIPEVAARYTHYGEFVDGHIINSIPILPEMADLKLVINNSLELDGQAKEKFDLNKLNVTIMHNMGATVTHCLTKLFIDKVDPQESNIPNVSEICNIFEYFRNLIINCIDGNILVKNVHLRGIMLNRLVRNSNNVPASSYECVDPSGFISFDMVPWGHHASPAEKYIFTFENDDPNSVSSTLLTIIMFFSYNMKDLFDVNKYFTECGYKKYGREEMSRALAKIREVQHIDYGDGLIHIEYCANLGGKNRDNYIKIMRNPMETPITDSTETLYIQEPQRIRAPAWRPSNTFPQIPNAFLMPEVPKIIFEPNPLLKDFSYLSTRKIYLPLFLSTYSDRTYARLCEIYRALPRESIIALKKLNIIAKYPNMNEILIDDISPFNTNEISPSNPFIFDNINALRADPSLHVTPEYIMRNCDYEILNYLHELIIRPFESPAREQVAINGDYPHEVALIIRLLKLTPRIGTRNV